MPNSPVSTVLALLLTACGHASDTATPSNPLVDPIAVTTSEQRFWDWFRSSEQRLYDFESDQERVFDELNQALNRVDKDLTFEFGPKRDDKSRDFVVSAGGLKSAFPAVEALVAAAPSLPRWNVLKFRPRRNPLTALTIGGTTIGPETVDCSILSNGSELGVYVFLRGYSESERSRWAQFGYLFLDEALGEHDVETKLGLIEFMEYDEMPEAERFPLPELAERFDQHYAQLKQR